MRNSFSAIVAAQARAALPVLSEIPDAALRKPLAFTVTGCSETAKGETVLNGTVTHGKTVFRAAIFGMSDILEALGGAEPKVDLVLELRFERNARSKGVFFARTRSESVTPAEAAAVVDTID
jgi:hypothetical protein